MKIVFGSITLCAGESASEFPVVSDWGTLPTIQTTKAIRRASIKSYDRQNDEQTFAFTVTHTEDSHKAVCAWFEDHQAALAAAPVATLQRIHEIAGTVITYSATLWALLSVRAVAINGCSITVSYSLKGAPLAKVT